MRKVFFFFITVLLFSLIYYLNDTHISFTSTYIQIGLNEEIRPFDYIKYYHKVSKEDITIINKVNIQKCGEYIIEYRYDNKKKKLKVIVKDILPPTFETVNKKILMNQNIEASELVKNIYDETDTNIYFKEKYIFDKEQTYKVEVVVEDAYKNKTVKTAYILVERNDKEAPVLQGLTPLTIREGQKVDLMKDIMKYDDHDNNPSVFIDDSQLNINKAGQYNIIYIIKDSYSNQNIYNRKVTVLDKYSNIEAKNDGIKTCYLTFDDGPSYNTPKVLEILDKYNIKATFFITGTHSDSYQYIKEISDRGHVLGLHTYSHDYEDIYTSLASYMKDLNKIRKLVKEKTGIDVYYMRFPGGSSNLVSKKYNVGIMKRLTKKVIDEGYQYYDWTCVNGDGENIKTVKGLVSKAKEEIGDLEDIMFLMHDGSQNNATVESLPIIIDYLIKKGYEFKVIDDYSPTFHHTVQN